jgi:hypothetical protein
MAKHVAINSRKALGFGFRLIAINPSHKFVCEKEQSGKNDDDAET